MKLKRAKTINEQIADFQYEEVTPETVGEEKKKHDKLILDVMEPAEKVADEVTDDTATPESKVKTAKRLVKDRKELASLIKEAKTKSTKFVVSRSLQEGYRYVFTEWLEEPPLEEAMEEKNEEEVVVTSTPAGYEVDEETKKSVAESNLNSLIQSKFADIENLKSIIISLQAEEINEDIINILNSILDDSNIHIGMLQKAVELVKPESSEAIEMGKEKAVEIAGSNEEEPAPEEKPEEEVE